MSTKDNAVAIVGTGYSKLERRSPRPLVLLTRDAALTAIADAGLQKDQIDGLTTYPALAPQTKPDVEIINVPSMQQALQLTGRVRWYAEPHEGMIGGGFVAAYHALRSGACDYALVWRSLHMPAKGRYNQPPPTEAADADQFTVPYGLVGLNGQFSALYTRYFDLYQGNRELLSTLAVNSRRFANMHPESVFRDVPLTAEEYMSSRMLTGAMCLYDCDVPIDGAAAVVMTTEERAKDLDVTPAYISGIVQGGPGWCDLWDLEGAYDSMFQLGGRLWKETGLGPSDMDCAMLYDGFSIFPIMWLEGLGFCERGEALRYIQDGRIGPGGELPLNTHGGSLSHGRLHGISHVIEAADQIRGRAGDRQVPGVDHVVATVALNLTGMAMTVSRAPV